MQILVGTEGARYRPLDAEQERALLLEYRRSGGARLEQRLVESNVRLVIKLAREADRSSGRDLDDLVQQGVLGLIEAVRRFDPAQGVRLGTYARFWIRAFILRYAMDNVRLVRAVRTRAQRAAFLKGDILTEAELSLDSTCDADAQPLRDRVADPSARIDAVVEDAELAQRVRSAAAALGRQIGRRDAAILRHRLMAPEPESRGTVARRLALSCERVRQIEVSLRATLRQRVDAAAGRLAGGGAR